MLFILSKERKCQTFELLAFQQVSSPVYRGGQWAELWQGY